MLIPERMWTLLTEQAFATAKTVVEMRRLKRAYTPQATVVIDRFGHVTLPPAIRRRAALNGHVVLTQTACSLEIKPEACFEHELESTRELNTNVERMRWLPDAPTLTPLSVTTDAEPDPTHPILKIPLEKIAELTAEELQLFTRECFWRMGYQCTEIGSTFTADGGIDLIAYSPRSHPFPYVLAVQVAMRKGKGKVGLPKLREFAGALQSLPINVGVLVTNATFSAQARWCAHQFNQAHSQKLWLRDLDDLKRWSRGAFAARHYADDIGLTLDLYKGGTFAIKNGSMIRHWRVKPETDGRKRAARTKMS